MIECDDEDGGMASMFTLASEAYDNDEEVALLAFFGCFFLNSALILRSIITLSFSCCPMAIV